MSAAAERARRCALAWLAVALVGLGAPGCAGPLALRPEMQRSIAQQYVGATVELRHSSFIGALYDDNERELLSPYRFEDIYDHVDPFGEPIHPAHARAIVPAGTVLRVEAIEYPSAWRYAQRMLACDHTAIWVRLALLHAPTYPVRPRPIIVALPRTLATHAAFDAAFDKIFAPEGQLSAWMQRRRPTVRLSIARKEMAAGMQMDELEAAMGPPWRWFVEPRTEGAGGGEARVAWWPQGEAWLRGQVVDAVRPSRTPP